MNRTYTDAGVSETRHFGTGGSPEEWSCQVAYNPIYDNSRTFTFENTRYTSLIQGDRVHAYPFSGYYTEFEPMEGTVFTNIFHTSGVSPHDYDMCKEAAGINIARRADIGYFVRNNLALESPPHDADLQEFLKQSAETAALSDLRRSFINLPLLIAERVETINLIRNKALQVTAIVKSRQTDALDRWRSSRGRDKRKLARDIAGEHLAVLFGVLPLIDEINGLKDLLEDPRSIKLTGRGRRSKVEEIDSSYQDLPSGMNWYGAPALDVQRTVTHKYSHRCSISVLVDIEVFRTPRDIGFNPLAATFDLIPLSFLLNFVSNIGQWLGSYDPLLGVTFNTGSSTSYQESVEVINVTGMNHVVTEVGQYSTTQCQGNGKARTRVLKIERSVLTDFPTATLLLQNNLTLAKAASVASLAVQRSFRLTKKLIDTKPFRYRAKRPKYLPPIKYR